MKGTSERAAGEALREVMGFVYKPPDDARNWKPADFLCWGIPRNSLADERTRSVWVEVKDGRGLGKIPASAIRKSQLAGIQQAMDLHIGYFILVRWGTSAPYTWTILEATQRERNGEPWMDEMRRSNHYWWDVSGTLRECIEDIIL